MNIEKESVVQMHYKLTNGEGLLLDSSEGREPLTYLHGKGMLIPGLENQLEGKVAGDKLTADVKADEAYGQRHQEMIHIVPKANFNGDGELKALIEAKVHQLNLTDKVQFWGKRNDVYELLCLFDVMVMPSLSEGLGVAALEAQAAGLPCVLSDTIPVEVDIGAGLCQFCSITEGETSWLNALNNIGGMPALSKQSLSSLFTEKGYSLEATRAAYIKAYKPR